MTDRETDPIEEMIRTEVRTMLKEMRHLGPGEKRQTAQAIASLFMALRDADTGSEDALTAEIRAALRPNGPRISPGSDNNDN